MIPLATWLVILGVVGIGQLYFWIREYGAVTGGLVFVARSMWLSAMVSCFFPRDISQAVGPAITNDSIALLLDDSRSMIDSGGMRRAKAMLTELDSECLAQSCRVDVTLLSEIAPETKQNLSPLGSAIEAWFMRTGRGKWMIWTDGGDMYPEQKWSLPEGLTGKVGTGAIVSFAKSSGVNISIVAVQASGLAFQDKTFLLELTLQRDEATDQLQRIQVQTILQDKLQFATNAVFQPKEKSIRVQLIHPPLPRGQHLLRIQALPLEGESVVWDNRKYFSVQVLPNTVGLLHLLGAPNWDGRFMRRFLKAEPKFDLISFFILRDKWDSNAVSERELSLIPFPVKRLFQDELPNFRAVVVQNFAVFEFLEPAFQENLVNYVLNGGSMLFIGGPRALQMSDISQSPLSRLLPFRYVGGPTANDDFSSLGAFFPSRPNRNPSFDSQRNFKIEAAKPSETKRALASIYDEWLDLMPQLKKLSPLQGMHRTENFKFDEKQTTPLLLAQTPDGKTSPLAVASYPGKGRAVWIFTDEIWRLAMAGQDGITRQTYDVFFASALRWLMRDEVRPTLAIGDLQMRRNSETELNWSFSLKGPIVRYIANTRDWSVRVCHQSIASDDLVFQLLTEDLAMLRGTISLSPNNSENKDKESCEVRFEANNAAFGSVRIQASAAVPRRYRDDEVFGSQVKVAELARLTGAVQLDGWTDTQESLRKFIASTQREELPTPQKVQVSRNYFWLFDSAWIYLLALGLPAEVLLRRRREIFG